MTRGIPKFSMQTGLQHIADELLGQQTMAKKLTTEDEEDKEDEERGVALLTGASSQCNCGACSPSDCSGRLSIGARMQCDGRGKHGKFQSCVLPWE